MLLDIAEALNPLFKERHDRLQEGLVGDPEDQEVAEMTLQVVFLDGEEAFVDWNATDSIYGARWISLTPSNYEIFMDFQTPCRKMGHEVSFSA